MHTELTSSSESSGPRRTDTTEAGAVALLTEPTRHTRWRILVVESDARDADALVGRLQRHGHDVSSVATGGEALQSYDETDLVLLDLELPDLDGLEICRHIRSSDDVPVIAVTARDTELDCVLGLQAGADDYLVKPYGFRELMARMEAVMRRASPQPLPTKVVRHGPMRIDPDLRQVTLDGTRIELTRKEFDLLYYLACHPDTVVPRKELMHRLWAGSWSRRTVDTHVSSLRGKLGGSDWIITVRGVGFRLGSG